MKLKTRLLITPIIVLDLYFILEFTIVIFILFFWIRQQSCIDLENRPWYIWNWSYHQVWLRVISPHVSYTLEQKIETKAIICP